MKRMNRAFSIMLVLSILFTSLSANVLAETEDMEAVVADMLEVEALPVDTEEVFKEEEIDLFEAMGLDSDYEPTPEPEVEATDIPEPALTPEPDAETEGDADISYSEELPGEAGVDDIDAPGIIIEPETTFEPEFTVEPEVSPEPDTYLEVEVDQSVVFLDAIMCETGAEDVYIALPEGAMPVAEIEGLVCDADYYLSDGLYLRGAWLQAQIPGGYELTICGADGNTYILPLTVMGAVKLETAPEISVENLFVDGVSVSVGSGEGWSFENDYLYIDGDVTLSGTGVIKALIISKTSGTVNLTLDNVDVTYAAVTDIQQYEYIDALNITLIGDNTFNDALMQTTAATKFYGEGSLYCRGYMGESMLIYENATVKIATMNADGATDVVRIYGGTLEADNISCVAVTVDGGALKAGEISGSGSLTNPLTVKSGEAIIDKCASTGITVSGGTLRAQTLDSAATNISGGTVEAVTANLGNAEISGGVVNVQDAANDSSETVKITGGEVTFGTFAGGSISQTAGVLAADSLDCYGTLYLMDVAQEMPAIEAYRITLDGACDIKAQNVKLTSDGQLNVSQNSKLTIAGNGAYALAGKNANIYGMLNIDAASAAGEFTAVNLTGELIVGEDGAVNIHIGDGAATSVCGVACSSVRNYGSLQIVNDQSVHASQVTGMRIYGELKYGPLNFDIENNQPCDVFKGVSCASIGNNQYAGISGITLYGSIVSNAPVATEFCGVYCEDNATFDIPEGKKLSVSHCENSPGAAVTGLYAGESAYINKSSGTGDIEVTFEDTNAADVCGLDIGGTAFIVSGSANIVLVGGENAVGARAYAIQTNSGGFDISISGFKTSAVGIESKQSIGIYGGTLRIRNYFNDCVGYGINKRSGEWFVGTDSNGQQYGTLDVLANRFSTFDGTFALAGETYSNASVIVKYIGGNAEVHEQLPRITVDGVDYEFYPGLKNASGKGWSLDADTCTLSLNNFIGGDIEVGDCGSALTVTLSGDNRVGSLYFHPTEVIFTGDGSVTIDHDRHSGTSRWGLYAWGLLLESGKINISGWDYGISCTALMTDAIDLTISECTVGCGIMYEFWLTENSQIRVDADYVAFDNTGVYLPGGSSEAEALDIKGSNHVVISGGTVVEKRTDCALTVEGVSYYQTDLDKNITGDGWKWVAADNAIVITDDVYSIAYAGEDTINVRIDANVWVAELMGENIVMKSSNGSALGLDVLACTDFTLESGKLETGALYGVTVVENLTVNGGTLECWSLYAQNSAVINGGTVNVLGDFVADSIRLNGGKLLVSYWLDCTDYKQTGGYASLCTRAWETDYAPEGSCVQADAFSMTGGELRLMNQNNSAPLIRAASVNIGGSANATLYAAYGNMIYADSLYIGGRTSVDSGITSISVKNGAVAFFGSTGNVELEIGNYTYTDFQLDNMSFSQTDDWNGYTWFWDHEKQQLTIYDDDIYDDAIYKTVYLDRYATINVKDSTVVNGVFYLGNGATFIGDGALYSHVVNTAGDLVFKNRGEMNSCIKNEGGNISLTGCTMTGGDIYAVRGSVTISDCNLQVNYVDSENNLTITNSLVYADDLDTDYNTIYARNKLKATNSILICRYYDGANGETLKNTAVFQWNYWDRNGIYWDCYSLRNSTTLKKSFTLPDASFYIPKGTKLTMASGTKLSYLGKFSKKGTFSGKKAAIYSPASITVSGKSLMAVGSSQTLNLTVSPSNSSKAVVWTSSAPELISVNRSNVATVMADSSWVGSSVTLTATSIYNGSCAGSIMVTIVPGAEKINITNGASQANEIELWLDPAKKAVDLNAFVTPMNASQDIAWKTTNKKIATVDATGNVTAKAAGTAYVYAVATDGTSVESQRVKVVVKKAPTSIKFTSSSATLGYDAAQGLGMTRQLSVKLSSGSASSIKYKSSNASVVSVDENGMITAKKAGTAKITATTYNKKSATCKITVKAAPSEIFLGIDSVKIALTDSYTFAPKITSGSVATYTFSSSNAAAAVIDEKGVLTPVALGETDITVTTFNGKTDTCRVKVVADPDAVVLDNTEIVLGKGETCYLKATPVLDNGGDTAATFSYKSSSSSKVKVSKDGKITAVKNGTATITVTSHDGDIAQCKVTVKKAPASIKLSASKMTLAYDEAQNLGIAAQLTAKLSSGSSSAVKFATSNPKVVEVDANGALKAVGVGSAKITASTFNKKKATCTVTVKPAPIEMVFDMPVYDVAINDTIAVSAKAGAGSYTPVVGYSVKEGVSALVDGDSGLVTPVALGQTVITAAAFNGAVGETVVNVVGGPDALALNSTKVTLKVKKKFTIKPVVTRIDGAATAASYTYKSSKSSIASVSSTGVITAKKKGTAVITVTSHNGLTAKITVNVK